MKRTDLINKFLIIILAVALLFASVSTIAYAEDDFFDITENTEDTTNTENTNTTNTNTTNTNTTNTNTTNTNTTNTNTTNTNTTNTDTTNTNATNTTNTNSEGALPNTGLEDSFPFVALALVAVVSAIVASKKIREYKEI